MVESAVGAQLLAKNLTHSSVSPTLQNWRDGTREVDFALRHKSELCAFEVKSVASAVGQPKLDAFCGQYPQASPLLLGPSGVPLQTWFLAD